MDRSRSSPSSCSALASVLAIGLTSVRSRATTRAVSCSCCRRIPITVSGGFAWSAPTCSRRAATTAAVLAPTGGPHVPIGDRVTLPVGVPEDEQNQSAWRRCGRCQSAYWDGNRVNKGQCPAGGPHAPTDPVLTLPHRSFRDDGAWQHPPTEPLQRRWRFCAKCAGLFWEGDFRQLRGICPKAGEHDPWGLRLPCSPSTATRTHIIRSTGASAANATACFGARGPAVYAPQDRAPHQAGAGPGLEGFNFALR